MSWPEAAVVIVSLFVMGYIVTRLLVIFVMPKSSAGKGDDPRPMSREGRKNYAETLAKIYGVRVKIPSPGKERKKLLTYLRQNSWPSDGSVPLEKVDAILQSALEAWVALEVREGSRCDPHH